ncbi:tRNA synthetases class I (M)-domain-containing protein [Xylaria flabelliformis]|nr:tRNA synthetases class I (M)-domain-containing protein [Xylaria flabelliformis]
MGSSTNTPLLPEPGKRNILITSALPYCNNVPHLGNIIGSVLSADCFARFSRARGLKTLYICGSDEYGTASETKALEEKTTPAELCSKYHEIHKRIYEDFSISFDIYGRTSTEHHTQIVQSIFKKLWENGFVEELETVQPYCLVHKSFLADRYVEGTCSLCEYPDARGDQCDKCGKLIETYEQKKEGTGFLINPRCKLDGSAPEPRNTKNIFLRLDKLQNEIKDWFETAKHGWNSTCVTTTEHWFKKGLEARSITRDLKWGVPIPKGLEGLSDELYNDKVFYVWFDACIGYPSITRRYTDGDDLSGTNWEKWWKNPKDVTLYQFMGKDNIPFHSIIFPACQLGTREDWTKVSRFSTTEYLNYERSKFSKSRGIGVFGTAVKDTGVDIDVWRFYLLRRRPETADSEFLWEDFININNGELLNKLGNLCQRVIKYCYNALEIDAVPDNKYTDDEFEKFTNDVNQRLQVYLHNMENMEFRNGTDDILNLADFGNKFVHGLFTEEGISNDKLKSGIQLALNLIHLVANLSCPYMPNIASSILTQLGLPKEEQNFSIPDVWTADALKPGHKLGTPTPLFSRIQGSQANVWKDQFGGDELKKKKEEEAAKAAAKKAAKQKQKEAKEAKKAAGASSAPST